MAGWLILVVGAIYLVVAGDLFLKGQHGLGIVFLFYALANVGMYMASIGH